VDRLLARPELREAQDWLGHEWIASAVRLTVEEARARIRSGGATPGPEVLARVALDRCRELRFGGLRRVLNATGVLLHTNLGRACLDAGLVREAGDAASCAVSVEMELATGERGNRYASVQRLLSALTGCESSLVVNNNAAAVLLVLNTFARDREVVLSRGELIEIGGSFRLPDIILASGARLREVGTTNRTHLSDFKKGVGPQTGLLMKTHTSNYRIEGFTKSVTARELMKLSADTGLPVYEDLGSGSLVDVSAYGLTPEPTVQQVVASGIPLVSFSGDKLLGGPQAGVIVGKKAMVDRLLENHLLRALRVDKFTMALLERSLQKYLDPKGPTTLIPTHRLLARSPEELHRQAEEVLARARPARLEVAVVAASSAVGGGACPTDTLPTWLLAVSSAGCGPDELARRFRQLELPVIGRVHDGRFCLDMRTVSSEDLAELAESLGSVDAGVEDARP
ncbi:MAG: L-seryl-tRNA(Sec) selenium transferase, partial [Candidatus Wallbacteria bacterium]|nr:L-seryl-tRNA(Sec) selenium transferase [Candidatus Wallbacteria bacterium]